MTEMKDILELQLRNRMQRAHDDAETANLKNKEALLNIGLSIIAHQHTRNIRALFARSPDE